MTLKSSFGFWKACIFMISTLFISKSTQAQTSDTLYIVDKSAQFVGGHRALSAYWQKHFKVPNRNRFKQMTGEGVVSFKIDTFGRVQDVFIKQRLSPELDAAAIKTVSEMPRWLPAEKDGKKIEIGQYMSYFLKETMDGLPVVDMDEAEKVVRQRGFIFGLWAGGMGVTGNFGDYMSPSRFALGLTFGYAVKRWQFAFEYDIAPPSKVRKTFQFDGNTTNTDQKISVLNVYMPIGYRWDVNPKWTLMPYVAPTLNSLDLKESKSDNDYKTINSATAYSFSLGVAADFLASKYAAENQKGKKRVQSAYVRTRLNINPMNFAATANSTQLQGTAISLTVGIFAAFKSEK
jgi:hypothetical protein